MPARVESGREARRVNKAHARAQTKKKPLADKAKERKGGIGSFGPFPGAPSKTAAVSGTQKRIRARLAPEVEIQVDRKVEKRQKGTRRRVRKAATKLWPEAAPLLGSKKKNRPRISFGGSDKDIRPGDRSRRIAHVRHGEKRIHLSPEFVDLFDKKPGKGRRVLLHEWAHMAQPWDKDTDTKPEREGGAEAFSRYAKKRITGKVDEFDPSHPYAQWVEASRKRGRKFIRVGQFYKGR